MRELIYTFQFDGGNPISRHRWAAPEADQSDHNSDIFRQASPDAPHLLMFALLMTEADQREAGKIGLPLVALEHWL